MYVDVRKGGGATASMRAHNNSQIDSSNQVISAGGEVHEFNVSNGAPENIAETSAISGKQFSGVEVDLGKTTIIGRKSVGVVSSTNPD